MGNVMEAKYTQAIKAGIIGGVILAACMLVNLFIEIINTDISAFTGLGLLSCCIFLVEIIVLLGTGALAVKMATSLVAKLDESLIVGGMAGAIAGLIGTIIQVVGAVIRPWLSNTSSYMNYYNYYPYDYGVGSSVLSMFGGVVGAACCCGPMLIIIGAVIAAIGGAIYAVVVLKIK